MRVEKAKREGVDWEKRRNGEDVSASEFPVCPSLPLCEVFPCLTLI